MKKLGAKFYNREALSNREAKDLFDPSQIRIYLVDENDSNIARPNPTRLSQGVYITYVDEEILENNKTYEIIWVYDLHPGCPQVLRYSFRYNDTPPVLTGMCRIYGAIDVNNLPSSGCAVMYSTLKSGYSSAFSQTNDKAVSDAFGEWSIYLKYGDTANVIIPEINERKFFVVPSETTKAYDDLTPLQLPVVTDSFGNPV